MLDLQDKTVYWGMEFWGRRGRPKRSERKAIIAHGLAGLAVAFEGQERLDEGSRIIGAAMLFLGGMLIVHGLLHRRLHQSRFIAHFEAAVFLIESIAFALISADFFERGKRLLPWLYVVLVIIYLILAAVRFVRHRAGEIH